VLWVLATVAAFLTAFYMTRQVIMTFFGEEKWRSLGAHGDEHDDADADLDSAPAHDGEHHGLTPDFEPSESSWIMTVPLVVLAGLSLTAGILNLPFSDRFHQLEHWLEPVIGEYELPHGTTLWVLVVLAVLVSVIGILCGFGVYAQHRVDPALIERKEFAHAWYIDETYAAVAGGPGRKAFDAMVWFDRNVIDKAVDGVGFLTLRGGELVRRVQSGRVRGYALGMACGAVVLLGYAVVRMGF